MAHEVEEIVPDSEAKRLALRVPDPIRPYWLLARFDRPIGSWLLFWPGAWAIALAGHAVDRWDLILWFGLGAVAIALTFKPVPKPPVDMVPQAA